MAERLDSPVLQAVTLLGGQTATARAISQADPALAVTRDNVQKWMLADTIPPAWMRVIYKLTGIPVEKFLEHEERRVKARKALL